jgi:hypothetical protein
MTLHGYLLSLFLTELIESAVAFALNFRKRREIAAVLLVNLVTHPLLHFYELLHEHYAAFPMDLTILTCMEAGIVFAEWGLLSIALRERSKRSLFLLSATMNTCSYLAGLAILYAVQGSRAG